MRTSKSFRNLCRTMGIGPERAITTRCIPYVCDHVRRVVEQGVGPCGVGSVDAITRRAMAEAGECPDGADAKGRYARVVAESVRSEVEKGLAMGTIPVDDAGYLLPNRVMLFSPLGYDTKDADQYIRQVPYTDRSVAYRTDPRRALACE